MMVRLVVGASLATADAEVVRLLGVPGVKTTHPHVDSDENISSLLSRARQSDAPGRGLPWDQTGVGY